MPLEAGRRRRTWIQAALLLAAACSESTPTAPTRTTPPATAFEPPLIIKTVSGAAGAVYLQVGQSDQLAAFLYHGDGTREAVESITWSSNLPAVATVTAEGTVTGQTIGEARVSAATGDGRAAYVRVKVTRPRRPVDPQFDDQYWKELVFNGHEEPSAAPGEVTRVLETPSPNFYIRLDNPGWPDWPSESQIAHMREAIPRLAEQLTGQPYRGRIETGNADREKQGWIAVIFERLNAACGRAWVGADPGRIWMSPDCFSGEGSFLSTFTHEVGHAFGFWHVSDYKATMWNGSGYKGRHFNAQEEYHAQLAYEAGRGQPYAGWPLKFGPTEPSENWPTKPLPVVVVDD